ncbi:asparaginase [Paenibacillus sp. GSMTC-2017]|uniref:asparaginase n=1 Tax=Paenibacillus sp. GSMTC-2017 TaxID=2794350 RepID=UPI0018D69D8F|nr:asparaginase domain-containing protein [Paenibacillus sp. GSMTC-2017]MBH5319810.1 asparaginase [Paenibacillus sp. GSMTC-2017]
MKQLLIIFTGGTIGSKAKGLEINVSEAGSYTLLEEYQKQSFSRNDVSFDTLQPLNLLSENITPNDWIQLATAIRQVDYAAYDGIIVTHGSDTLAYTAAMMGYLFNDIPLPMVLTASNYPIADERSNGIRNLSSSIDFVMDGGPSGVFVVYENDKGQSLVYLGTRIMQNESFTDQFRSPYELTYGTMTSERSFHWQADRRNPTPESMGTRVSTLNWEPAALGLEDSVLYIKPYPGLNYSLYEFGGKKPRAVLHDLHHSGTACALASGKYSLLSFIERCKENGIDVYLCPIKDASDALYESSHRLIEAGARFIENMSIEAALTKLMIAYGLYADGGQADTFVRNESIYFEKVELQS